MPQSVPAGLTRTHVSRAIVDLVHSLLGGYQMKVRWFIFSLVSLALAVAPSNKSLAKTPPNRSRPRVSRRFLTARTSRAARVARSTGRSRMVASPAQRTARSIQSLHHLARWRRSRTLSSGCRSRSARRVTAVCIPGNRRPRPARVGCHRLPVRCGPHQGDYNGMLYEERGRRILAHAGERVIIDTRDSPWVVGEFPLREFKPDQWHEYRVLIEGNHHRHWIDGHPTVDVIDLDTKGRKLDGVLAVQVSMWARR